MRIPQPPDFRALERWGMIADPLVAISDYSEEHGSMRWTNERHCRAHAEYIEASSDERMDDTQAYYRTLDRPIDRTKWEYLKQRKAWFNPPLEWGRFASPGTSRLLDVGCGDGDQTQRVAEFVAGRWQAVGYDGFPLEIVGVDLSESRLENARRHTASPHEKITLRFEQGDPISGLDCVDDYFDYALAMGILEVLDEQFYDLLAELRRVTARGLYVSDILEDYPWLTPRPDMPDLLAEHGYEVVERHELLQEPFTESGTLDPLGIWPMNLHQVLFAVDADPTPCGDRY